MGETLSTLVRPLRNINVKNRAFREISKEKPKRAPHHPTTIKYLEKMLMKASPPVPKMERMHLTRLKRIFVTSEDPNQVKLANIANHVSLRLPQNRKPVTDLLFGYLEPHRLPEGKVTLRQALLFIAKHQRDIKWSVPFICRNYQLRSGDVNNILKHFTPFKTYVPGDEDQEWNDNTKKLRRMTAGKPKLLALKNK